MSSTIHLRENVTYTLDDGATESDGEKVSFLHNGERYSVAVEDASHVTDDQGEVTVYFPGHPSFATMED